MAVKAAPSRHRAQKLKQRYDLTEEEYDAMLEKQRGKCGICGRYRRLSVDHKHDASKKVRVRGLLCSHCNSGLGLFGESIAVLRAAIQYITTHEGAE